MDGSIKLVNGDLKLEPQEHSESVLIIDIPEKEITERATDVKIAVYHGDKELLTEETLFLGPRR